MKNIFSQIKNQKLSTEEKAQMILNLNKFVEANPLKNSVFKTPIKSPFYSNIWVLSKQRKVVFPATVVLVFVLTTGTVFGANSSLPGDVLYPVKKFNEKVEAVVALGTKAKTRVSTEHAISRLKEAEELASKGKLTTEKAIELENEFQKHFEKIEKNIEKIKNENGEDNAKETFSVFEDSVSKQNDSIDKMSKHEDLNESTKVELEKIKKHVEKEFEKRKSRDEERKHEKNDDNDNDREQDRQEDNTGNETEED